MREELLRVEVERGIETFEETISDQQGSRVAGAWVYCAACTAPVGILVSIDTERERVLGRR